MHLWRILGLGWLLFLSVAYFWPTDLLYAITIWPPFVWAGLGLVLTLFGIRKRRTKLQLGLLVAWIAFWLAFGEEKHWLGDRLQNGQNPDLVVVTLNCAGGSNEAAEEAFELKPDLILFQESPSERELRALAQQYYGNDFGLVWGVDATIVSRSKSLKAASRSISHTEAWVDTDSGRIQVISFRLSPPVFRLDYWNPECWTAYALNRQLHREELGQIGFVNRNYSTAHRAIVGGDVNWTPDREMSRILRSLFPVSQGSGYSAVNEFPLARIDQMWVSKEFRGISEAVATKNSDHRMVIVRLWAR